MIKGIFNGHKGDMCLEFVSRALYESLGCKLKIEGSSVHRDITATIFVTDKTTWTELFSICNSRLLRR